VIELCGTDAPLLVVFGLVVAVELVAAGVEEPLLDEDELLPQPAANVATSTSVSSSLCMFVLL